MLDHNALPTGIESTGALHPRDHEVRELEQRLQRGWNIIEATEARGEPTEHLVDHFLTLLAQYESAYRLASAA